MNISYYAAMPVERTDIYAHPASTDIHATYSGKWLCTQILHSTYKRVRDESSQSHRSIGEWYSVEDIYGTNICILCLDMWYSTGVCLLFTRKWITWLQSIFLWLVYWLMLTQHFTFKNIELHSRNVWTMLLIAHRKKYIGIIAGSNLINVREKIIVSSRAL